MKSENQRNFGSEKNQRYRKIKKQNFISVKDRKTKKIGYRVLFCHNWKGLGKEEQRNSIVGGYFFISGKTWEKSTGL